MAVELSLIVPARGGLHDLIACLESLAGQKTSIKYEIIVAYCDKDMQVQNAVSRFPDIIAITSNEYLLPGDSRNLGAAASTADVLAFIDSDCILQSDWITNALRTIRDGAVLCSGAIRDTFPWNLIASSDNRLQYADFPPGRPYGVAQYFPGAHLAVRRHVFDAVGGFCDSPHGQDVIFTMKIASRWPSETIFNPKMVASHAGRRTLRELISHNQAFGYARAVEKIKIKTSMAWIAQHPWLRWILFWRRLAYISFRVVQWNLIDLPRYLLQIPFVIVGLLAWTTGFYKGMQSRKQDEHP